MKHRKVGEVGMRLIDADALADALFEKRKNYPQWMAETIGNMPDAVVRCKDCKHGCIDSVSYPQFWCYAHSEYHKPDWFCADGERK